MTRYFRKPFQMLVVWMTLLSRFSPQIISDPMNTVDRSWLVDVSRDKDD